WDRLAKGDDTSSCWVRVSSAWAGQGYGGVQIPRVGDEVVVDFINGDPDRPIITGRVYNDASMPPWALPAAATQMGFMSRTKDGSVDNANALRFEDKAGAEQVWLQAERNLDINVKNDESHATEKNRTQFVGENETLRVVKNQQAGVKGDVICLTGNSRSDKVVNNFIISAGNTLRLECGESAIELSKDGSVNIIGNNFNFTAKQNAQINTLGGELHLNPAGGSNAIDPPGASHQSEIQQEVDSFFVINANK
ncbi:type VI secretion system tip protein TssI/VgrG, partial [Enterobacter sichuanensis]